ncbi:hypothetical protein CYY_006144 [Polysphondylium violaceum]|uniref:Flavohemoprotein n=1 Tax=Polysphondylium violaceum TaxID=133409 RepID=A0A8J4PSE5_9MYCE|nr:hypothetical protein CYY_006144 [Polysphondylium violaceum]
MLKQETIDIIKATVPVLEVHGTTITTTFYKSMFAAHPELLNIFNHTNQREGRQQNALANTVLAAAKNIENLGALLPAVMQIAHKHRALGIKPEHYPIVGENLLGAIKTVLGDAATPAILGAWGEAYGVIAKIFIDAEAELYKQTEAQAGGWADFRPFVVDRKVKESSQITSFYFKPQDKGPIAAYEPGQYITVRINTDSNHTAMRHYSLSDISNPDYYRISIKKETNNTAPNGVVSTYLHDNVNEGDVVYLSAPAGDFVVDLKKESPLIFISGGVGITPLLSMMKTTLVKQPKRKVMFIHSAKSSEFCAFRSELVELSQKNTESLKVSVSFTHVQNFNGADETKEQCDHMGKIDVAYLRKTLDDKFIANSDVYICGPVEFMKAINSQLKEIGVPSENVHYEVFGPLVQV